MYCCSWINRKTQSQRQHWNVNRFWFAESVQVKAYALKSTACAERQTGTCCSLISVTTKSLVFHSAPPTLCQCILSLLLGAPHPLLQSVIKERKRQPCHTIRPWNITLRPFRQCTGVKYIDFSSSPTQPSNLQSISGCVCVTGVAEHLTTRGVLIGCEL